MSALQVDMIVRCLVIDRSLQIRYGRDFATAERKELVDFAERDCGLFKRDNLLSVQNLYLQQCESQ